MNFFKSVSEHSKILRSPRKTSAVIPAKQMRCLRRWIVILLLGIFSSSSPAQSSRLFFAQLGIDEGLSAVDVRALLQDRYGFIWIGTLDGLDLYDGYGFTHFKHKPFDSTSLSANAITALHEDKNGTLWVGTVNGLCRMNAEERAAGRFRQYLHDPADSTSLSSDAVTAICEDSSGNIWAGSLGGLNRLDQRTNRFKRYRWRLGNPFGLNNDNVTTLCSDGNGILWVGTARGGLQKFDTATEKFFTYTWQHPDHKRKYERYRPGVFTLIDSLQKTQTPLTAALHVEDSEHRENSFTLNTRSEVLIVATGEGVVDSLADRGWMERAGATTPVWQMHVDRTRHAGGSIKNRVLIDVITLPAGSYTLHYLSDDSHSFDHWNAWLPDRPQDWGVQVFAIDAAIVARLKAQLPQSYLPTALSNSFVTKLIPDPDEESSVLWVGTINGLSRFDTIRESFINYFHDPADSNSLSSNTIIALCAGDSGSILIGAIDGGLHRYDPKLSRLARLDVEAANKRGFDGHRINTILRDRAGNVWIGTGDTGLYKSTAKKFRHHLIDEISSAASNNVLAICEDRDGVLWLGTAGGLFAYDRAKSSYTQFKHDPKNPKSLSGNLVNSIYEDDTGALWIATLGGGLNRLDRASKTFTHYLYNPKDSTSLSTNLLRAITGDHRGRLWIATSGGGLNHFDPKTGHVKRYLQNPADSRSLPASDLFHVYVGRSGTLWVGTVFGGVAQFEEATQRFKNFTYDPSDTSGFINKTVNNVFEDRDGQLWFGTYSGGLSRMLHHADGRITFTHYTVDDGLPGNMIQGIVQDDDGIFWISTNNGLSRFDPSQARGKQFRNYSIADGLQSKLFNRNAFCKSRNGEIFFGGMNGVNGFFPHEVEVRNYSPPVILTQFKIFDQASRYPKPLSDLEVISLDYDRNFFSFEFVALDYSNAANVRYAYKLEGLNEDWIQCGVRRYASFTNIDPGEYVFRVKATNGDGVWGQNEASIHISISPPFWQTAWFYLVSIGAFILAGYALFQYRVRARVRKALEHERIRIYEREKVREQIARDYHDEMGHKITKVSLFTELIKRNVNGIVDELKEHLDKVLEASQSLSLDARDFIWALNPEKDSLYELCLHLQEFGDALFEDTEVNFQVKGLSEALAQTKLTMEWKRHLTLLFKEGMNNALKHARSKNATLAVNVQNGILHISFKDDGAGLSHSSGNHRNGKGAGLENMKRRAQLLRGKLDINSAEGKGTTILFSCELPKNGY